MVSHPLNILDINKNIFKGATQVKGHFLKLHFYMFERSQMKHNGLDCHYFFTINFIIAKFTSSKLNINLKCFCMFKVLKPREWTIFFFQMSFLNQMCTISFEN
jgi:hypothetical protein